MRHSDTNLTLSRYTHTLLGQETKAVDSLPDLSSPGSKSEKVAVSETDGKPVDDAREAKKGIGAPVDTYSFLWKSSVGSE